MEETTQVRHRPQTPPTPLPPAATFEAQDGDTFELWEVPHFDSDTPHQKSSLRGHPDSRVVTVSIQDGTATIEFESINVTRDVDLTLYVQQADETYHTTHATLPSTDDGFHTQTIEVDVTEVSITPGVGNRIELTATDPQDEESIERLLTVNHHLAVSYTDGSDTKLYTYPDRVLNTGHYARDGTWGYTESPDLQDTVQVIETEGGQTFINAASYQGRWWGATTTIPDDQYTVRELGDYNGLYDAATAQDRPYLVQFAENIYQAQTNAGITAPFERIESLGQFIQSIPYEEADFTQSPAHCLVTMSGDCAEKAAMFNGILQCEPFTVRTGYVWGDIREEGHLTSCVDERDLGSPPSSLSIHYITPSQEQIENGAPDTRYAFFDVTGPNKMRLGTVGRDTTIDRFLDTTTATLGNAPRVP